MGIQLIKVILLVSLFIQNGFALGFDSVPDSIGEKETDTSQVLNPDESPGYEENPGTIEFDRNLELATAAEKGDLATVKLLVQQGANPSGAPLILALENQQNEVVDYLMSQGADLAVPDSQGRTVWTVAIQRSQSIEKIQSTIRTVNQQIGEREHYLKRDSVERRKQYLLLCRKCREKQIELHELNQRKSALESKLRTLQEGYSNIEQGLELLSQVQSTNRLGDQGKFQVLKITGAYCLINPKIRNVFETEMMTYLDQVLKPEDVDNLHIHVRPSIQYCAAAKKEGFLIQFSLKIEARTSNFSGSSIHHVLALKTDSTGRVIERDPENLTSFRVFEGIVVKRYQSMLKKVKILDLNLSHFELHQNQIVGEIQPGMKS